MEINLGIKYLSNHHLVPVEDSKRTSRVATTMIRFMLVYDRRFTIVASEMFPAVGKALRRMCSTCPLICLQYI